jgi:hypothetical protein
MSQVDKRIERLEKSVPPEPEGQPVVIFLDPGETAAEKIAEHEANQGPIGSAVCWIVQFVEPEVENVQEKETDNE